MRNCILGALLVMAAGCMDPQGNPAGGGLVPGQGGEPSKPAPLPPLAGAPTRPKGTVEDRIKEADAAFAAKDYTKAVRTLEEAVVLDAKNRQVLLKLTKYGQARALALRKEKSPEYYPQMRSASYYLRSLRDNFPDATEEEKALSIEVLYNEATGHALSKRVEETTGAMRDLIGYGFKDFDRIEKDPDWADIRAVPQFQTEWDKIRGPKK